MRAVMVKFVFNIIICTLVTYLHVSNSVVPLVGMLNEDSMLLQHLKERLVSDMTYQKKQPCTWMWSSEL